MRDLTSGGRGPLTDDDLATLYAVPRTPWLRANMVTTLDGAATGANGRSGGINNAADKRVFDLLRAQCDAILVGAGTARTERYGPVDRPIVLVSRSARLPSSLAGAPRGSVLLVTTTTAPRPDGLDASQVLAHGTDEVDLAAALVDLRARGLGHLLCEGGPSLLTDLLAAGLVDELCLTVVPLLVGGDLRRITAPTRPLDATLELVSLVEEGGTVLGRWLRQGSEVS